MWETLGTSSHEQGMEGSVAFKVHVGQWDKVSMNKTSVVLDGILTEAMYPKPLDVIVSLPTLFTG